MDPTHCRIIAEELHIEPRRVAAVARLLDDQATIPFIARYRKEITGSLDEVAVAAVRDRLQQLRELDARRQAVMKSLEERELLSEELGSRIRKAGTMAELEDIYLPYRPKRRTRAAIAREKGLEPLAEFLLVRQDESVHNEAERFIEPESGVESVEDALAGARDIIAERINEDPDARAEIRELFLAKAIITSRVIPGKEEEGNKFSDYFDWSEPAMDTPSHRILAVRRGENEGILTVRIQPDREEALELLRRRFITGSGEASYHVASALEDGYKRLMAPSMETEMRVETKSAADAEAITVFTENLRPLLMAPPLGQKRVLAVDPGFRTGCKIVVLNEQGKLLHNDTIFPHPPQQKTDEARHTISTLCRRFGINAIAVGNGTAGRETESFIRKMKLESILVVMVNESGASVYSASESARQEFPDHDVTVRGAVSIGRRLMDPLAELVKIDPKSIGVGQYQHDVDQSALKTALDDTVMSCVNAVGVEVNTASRELLSYVSGLGPQLAGNIVAHRDRHGPFRNRREILKVHRLGPKAFEQCAGFLRIRSGDNPLDASAVHPERYALVERMAGDLDSSIHDLMTRPNLRKKIDPNRYIDDTVGLPTLKDILSELEKPGRDPRDSFEAVRFDESVTEMEDLEPGMVLTGVVTNVTRFGAFVDIGVHQDGLVHISELADRFIKDPSEVVQVGGKVRVKVLTVDAARRRIGLSIRQV